MYSDPYFGKLVEPEEDYITTHLQNKINELKKINILQAQQLLDKDREIVKLRKTNLELRDKIKTLKVSSSQHPAALSASVSLPRSFELPPSTSQGPQEDPNTPAGTEEEGNSSNSKYQTVRISRFKRMNKDMCSDHLKMQAVQYVKQVQELLVGKVISKGAYGIVFEATFRGTKVAVKRLSSGIPNKDQCIEVELCMKLRHKNIMSAEFFFYTKDELQKDLHLLNMVMPFMDKCDLRVELEARNRDFSHLQSNKICFEVSKALAYLHAQRVVHRDLKPENIFVSSKNEIKLGDFGISADCSQNIKSKGTPGTLPYMAPEVCSGRGTHNSKVDIWALGVIFCELISKIDNAPFCYDDEISEEAQKKIICNFCYPLGVNFINILQAAFAKKLQSQNLTKRKKLSKTLYTKSSL